MPTFHHDKTMFSFPVVAMIASGAIAFGALQFQVLSSAATITDMKTQYVTKTEMSYIRERLDRIDNKLDRLMLDKSQRETIPWDKKGN